MPTSGSAPNTRSLEPSQSGVGKYRHRRQFGKSSAIFPSRRVIPAMPLPSPAIGTTWPDRDMKLIK
jgi:hypothetical protein